MPAIQNTLTGTHDISSLLAVKNQSVKEFGMDTIVETLQADMEVHNAIVMDMVDGLCEITTDQLRIYGSSSEGEMVEVDEFGRSATQTTQGGVTVGFPLRQFQYAIGWTDKWMAVKTPEDMAKAQIGAQDAHKRRIIRDIKTALYLSGNYTFNDFLVDKVDIAVKRLLNADGAKIPNGPNGEPYDGSTHSHYNFAASLTAAALTASVNDVIEHGYGNRVALAIDIADETAVKALTGFVPYADPRIVYRNTDTPGQTLDITRLNNRAIGLFGAAEVWVKPWAIASYPFAWDMGSPRKPLAFRQRAQTTLQGLRIAATNATFPLYAQYMEAEYGIGVWTRNNGAVLYTGSGSAYADPAL